MSDPEPLVSNGVSVYFCSVCRTAPTPTWTGITYAYAWRLLPGNSGFFQHTVGLQERGASHGQVCREGARFYSRF